MKFTILKQKNFWYIVVILLALYPCLILFMWIREFSGEGFYKIELEKAQSLVVFPICVPEQPPKGIGADVKINYFLDSGEPKSNADIYLHYKNIKNYKLEIEILETHTKALSIEDFDVKLRPEQVKVIILYKLANRFKLFTMSQDQIEEEVKQIQLRTVVNENKIVWVSYEIIEPEKYRSTMSEWIANNVHYRVFSFLPVEDLNNFTLSMIEQCY